MATRSRPIIGRSVAALTMSAAIMAVHPAVASAHAFLVSSTPQSGERLDAAPASITLRFSERIAGGEQVILKTPGGSEVPVGQIQGLEGGLVVRALLPQLRDGVYIVSWQVLGSDGDRSLGEFAFAIGGRGQLPTLSAQGPGSIDWPRAGAGWLLLMGLLLGFGGLVSERFIWRPVERDHSVQIPRSPVAWVLELALVGGALQFFLLVRDTAGAAVPEPTPAPWVAVLTSRPGVLAAGQLVLVAYGLWLLALKGTRPFALVPLALAVVVAAIRGHAGATSEWWAGPANTAHLLAVAIWVGALVHLVLVGWRLRAEELRPALIQGARRYAATALVLVGLAVVTGAVVALSQFTTPADLVRTTYGRALLVKAALVTTALALAYVARRRALGAKPEARFGLLRRLTRPEGVALVVAVAAAVVMASTATPKTVLAVSTLLGPPPLEGKVVRTAGLAGTLAVYLGATDDQMQLRVLEPSGNPAYATIGPIRGRAPDGRHIAIAPRSCGPGCATVAFGWQPGVTHLRVPVSSEGWGGGMVALDVGWPPGKDASVLLRRVVKVMSSQPEVTLVERVTSAGIRTSGPTVSLTGAEFVAQEPYAAGGATDIRLAPGPEGVRALTLFLPGSWIWFRLELDDHHRLVRETAVSPNNLIRRTFTYVDGER